MMAMHLFLMVLILCDNNDNDDDDYNEQTSMSPKLLQVSLPSAAMEVCVDPSRPRDCQSVISVTAASMHRAEWKISKRPLRSSLLAVVK